MRILCSGDLHIGRGSSKIPVTGDRAFTCSATWDRLVDCAITNKAGLVLLSGDLVDRANRRYEAYGALERGIIKLSEHGIRTCAVAGNHDFDVLPAVARNLDPQHFTLLGKNGEWENTRIEIDGRPVVELTGWSFPKNVVGYSPLDSFSISSGGDVPVIGLLHTELETKESRYAPVPLADLQRHDVALWLLGHVHAPNVKRGGSGQVVLNPGSPQAMDPGEHGSHGPFLIEISGGVVSDPVQVQLSTVLYGSLEIDVDGIEDELQCHSRIRQELQTRLDADAQDSHSLSVASYRVKITGETLLHSGMGKILAEIEPDQLRSGDASLHIERVKIETRPPVDLPQLAEGRDVLATLAKVLVSIDLGTVASDYQDLLRDTRRKLEEIHESAPYVGISGHRTENSEDNTPDDSIATEHLRTECRNMLAALLAQREAR